MSSNNDPPTPSSLFTFKTSKHHLFPTTANNNNDDVIPWESMRQAFQSFLASSSDKTSFFSRFTTTSNSSSLSLMSPMFSSHHPHHTIQHLNSPFFRNSSDSATIGANNHESSNSSSGDGNGNDDNDAKAKSSEIHNYWDYKQPHHFEFDNVTTTRKIFSIAATVFFGYMCKAWMKLFHTITFINRESFEDLVWVHWLNLQRVKREAAAASSSLTEHGEQQENNGGSQEQQQQELTESHVKVPGLLTVLNHASMMDEPFLFANLIPSTWYFNPEILRSPICAADQCFANFVFAEVAKTLRILPMQRGGSINQSAMDIAINKLSSGHWISVFPEGYIKQDGEIHTIRRGVGKLILDSDPTPRVYPIYHRGMEGVKSERKWLPSFGAHVVVKLGREIRFDDLIEDFKNGKTNQDDTYILIANRIQKKLNDLKKEVDEYRAQHNIRNKAEDEV